VTVITFIYLISRIGYVKHAGTTWARAVRRVTSHSPAIVSLSLASNPSHKPPVSQSGSDVDVTVIKQIRHDTRALNTSKQYGRLDIGTPKTELCR